LSDAGYNVLLLGSGEAAVPSLEVLNQAPYKLLAVITQPDRPSGRGGRLSPTPLKQAAIAAGIRALESENASDLPGLIERFADIDAVVVIDFSQIIPEEVFQRWPTVNIHFSLLPKFRGPSPVEATILAGESETGVTFMEIDREIDHGPIISQQSLPLTRQTAGELRTELAQLGAKLLAADLQKYLRKELTPTPQDHAEATFTKKLTAEDGRIDWSKPAEEIDRRIRAVTPRPGAYTLWEGKRIKILRAEPVDRSDLTPGQVDEGELVIGTGSGAITIEELQLEGKNPTSASDFLHGYPQILGSQLSA
jgi:methionyl-tRNA formyltransferase